jgi:putative NADH-flavin reductase
MKLLVFGATGGTGRELLKQALEEDHHVTALARNPAKIDDINHPNVRVLRGDVLDPAAVERAVASQEGVLCAIGAAAARTSLREEGTRNIIAAMEKAGVRRLIVQSSLGVGDSRANLSFFTKHVIVRFFLRHAFADHERQEALVKQCSLDWIIVRPPRLFDGPRTGVYRHGFSTADRQIRGRISRADVADFMLKQLANDGYLHQTPGVSY